MTAGGGVIEAADLDTLLARLDEETADKHLPGRRGDRGREFWQLRHGLTAILPHDVVEIVVEKSESPDFLIRWRGQTTIGVELTEATTQSEAAFRNKRSRDGGTYVSMSTSDLSRTNRYEKDRVDALVKDPSAGHGEQWDRDEPRTRAIEIIRGCIEKKIGGRPFAALPDLAEPLLVVYFNSGVPYYGDYRDVMARLREAVRPPFRTIVLDKSGEHVGSLGPMHRS